MSGSGFRCHLLLIKNNYCPACLAAGPRIKGDQGRALGTVARNQSPPRCAAGRAGSRDPPLGVGKTRGAGRPDTNPPGWGPWRAGRLFPLRSVTPGVKPEGQRQPRRAPGSPLSLERRALPEWISPLQLNQPRTQEGAEQRDWGQPAHAASPTLKTLGREQDCPFPLAHSGCVTLDTPLLWWDTVEPE